MSQKFLIGNWKSNTLPFEGAHLAFEIEEAIQVNNSATTVVICPPLTHLALMEGQNFELGAQNVSSYGYGAYTWEVTASMLAELGVSYCLVGHSERRSLLGEASSMFVGKITELVSEGIVPVFCVGESLSDRESGIFMSVLEEQMNEVIGGLPEDVVGEMIIAYEPVWAIGTGKIPTLEQITETHKWIRTWCESKFGAEIAKNMPILYGGSVKSSNARSILSCEWVDGALVGGASLKSEEFVGILRGMM